MLQHLLILHSTCRCTPETLQANSTGLQLEHGQLFGNGLRTSVEVVTSSSPSSAERGHYEARSGRTAPPTS
eukprot:4257283-Prymnesium_polylepis.1